MAGILNWGQSNSQEVSYFKLKQKQNLNIKQHLTAQQTTIKQHINPHYSPILYTKHINALVYSLLKMGFANFIKPKFGCLGIIFMHLLRCKTLEIPKYSLGFRRLVSA